MAKLQGQDKGNAELVLPVLLPLQQGTEPSHTPSPAAMPAKKLQPKLLFELKTRENPTKVPPFKGGACFACCIPTGCHTGWKS